MFKLMNKSGIIVAENVPSMLYAKRMAGALGNVYITDENNGIISFHSIEEYYKNAIRDLVVTGATVQFDKLSICCINDYYKPMVENQRPTLYQVEYNDRKNEYSKLHKSVRDAVDDFVRLEVKHGR
jgi:hypothetical protein